MRQSKMIILAILSRVHSSIVPEEDKHHLTKPVTEHTDVNLTDTVNKVEIERKVYLEDVFYSLKNQKWDPEEHLCLNRSLEFLTNLQNFSLWAVAMWDSMASEPRGVLYGTRYQLGNFDECLKPSWSPEEHPHLSTQYCLADVELVQEPRNVPKYKTDFSPYSSALDKLYYTGDPSRHRLDILTWGICVPWSCSPRSVERLLTALLLRSSLINAGVTFNITMQKTCQRMGSQDYTSGAAVFYSVCGILSAIVVISTAVHWYVETFSEDKQKGAKVSPAIQAFSLIKNLPSLARSPDDSLRVLNGIRYISVCIVVTGHRYGIFAASALSNGLESDRIYKTPVSVFIVHFDLVVDTFFFMSGLLVTKSLLSTERFPNFFVHIFKRYMRLAPGLAMLLFYICTVLESAGRGPLWPRYVEYDIVPCKKNWWVNMLMLTNYLRVDNLCLPSTWYIPADFHLFILASWMCYNIRISKYRGYMMGTILMVAAVAIPAIITAYYQLPGTLLFYISVVLDPRSDETFQRVYIPSHTRAAAYLIGVAVGYLVTKKYPLKGNIKRWSMRWSCVGAAVGLLIMVVVMGTGCLFYTAGKQYEPVEAAVYAALNRPVWTLGVAMVVLCCVYGTVPVVTDVLSWSPFVPLSKLAFGVYLTHMLIIARDVHVARDPGMYDLLVLIHRTVADIAWATVAALLLWLAVEAPINNLLTIMLALRRSRPTAVPATTTHNEVPELETVSQVPSPKPTLHIPSSQNILRSKC